MSSVELMQTTKKKILAEHQEKLSAKTDLDSKISHKI